MPRQRGRNPCKLTQPLIEALATHVLAGNTVKCACALLQVPQSTYYLWLNQAKKLQRDLIDGRACKVARKSDKLLLELLESISTAAARCEARQVSIIQQAATGTGKFEKKGADPQWAWKWLRVRSRQDWGKDSESVAGEDAGDERPIVSIQEQVEAMIQSVTGTPEQLVEMLKLPLDGPAIPPPPPEASDISEDEPPSAEGFTFSDWPSDAPQSP